MPDFEVRSVDGTSRWVSADEVRREGAHLVLYRHTAIAGRRRLAVVLRVRADADTVVGADSREVSS